MNEHKGPLQLKSLYKVGDMAPRLQGLHALRTQLGRQRDATHQTRYTYQFPLFDVLCWLGYRK